MFFDPSMIQLATTVLALTFGFCIMHAPFKHFMSRNFRPISSALAACLLAKELLVSTAENATVHLQSLFSKEAARAQPNQRLQAAFGIDNCFITDDKKRCAEFRGKVAKLIHVELDKWQEFAAAAKAIVQKEFDTTDNTIKLFILIQLVTMKMTRKVMWNIDPQAGDNDEAIRGLADEVNKHDKPDWHSDQQHDLQKALNEAFPNWTVENPLNLILPGYETMCRVVLRCFVEVTSRSHENAPQWEKDQETGYDFLVAADVEAMHQDKGIWGATARLFDPSRWLSVDEKKEDDIFMPFGAAPFRCPAKQHRGVYMPFGVAMIALLVGALVEGVDGKWVCEGEGS
ncbi:hypothetical protein M409DRAFT_70083 [Zasmidium cellare ATCC 36951]|uniref:Cytochrome P450 n=1 Tax=Zasmidium cellare ATCC 36951 TaxID=1080233 RepID=A0A6A6C5J3_ZASCE|nr:uncharacterized protein M409DRAFT_70083 [Zasmidium cellare ATCC 36951]KAF2161009.1 hypothetical protein M409DRAFT_70083 [Zasmidium cellare ATCC 36951]